MTKIDFKKNERSTIAAISVIGSVAILLTMAIMFPSQPAASQVESKNTVTLVGMEKTGHPTPPDPFAISINGHPESTYVVTIERGQTAKLDVFVNPKIAGIIGHVSTQSGKMECSSYNIPGCMPGGITASISTNNIASPTHLLLTISVPTNYPVGTYTYEVMATTPLKVPYQSTPVNDGDLHGFRINVI